MGGVVRAPVEVELVWIYRKASHFDYFLRKMQSEKITSCLSLISDLEHAKRPLR